jgi:hypothetical protein
MSIYRIVVLVLLGALLAFYCWLTFRGDGRLMTVPGMPRFVWVAFDYATNFRNFPAFLLVGILGAAAVAGLGSHWQYTSLAVCLLAPFLKDCVQIPMVTRHFHWGAVTYGVAGALVGWMVAASAIRWATEVD